VIGISPGSGRGCPSGLRPPAEARALARGRARAWGGVEVVCGNQGDWEASSAVGPSPGGQPAVRDGPRARLRNGGKGAGSGELLQRGKRMWVDAGTVEPHGSDRV